MTRKRCVGGPLDGRILNGEEAPARVAARGSIVEYRRVRGLTAEDVAAGVEQVWVCTDPAFGVIDVVTAPAGDELGELARDWSAVENRGLQDSPDCALMMSRPTLLQAIGRIVVAGRGLEPYMLQPLHGTPSRVYRVAEWISRGAPQRTADDLTDDEITAAFRQSLPWLAATVQVSAAVPDGLVMIRSTP